MVVTEGKWRVEDSLKVLYGVRSKELGTGFLRRDESVQVYMRLHFDTWEARRKKCSMSC